MAVSAPVTPEFATLALTRLGYGPRPGDVEAFAHGGLAAFLDEQLAPPRGDDPACAEKLSRATLKIAYPAGSQGSITAAAMSMVLGGKVRGGRFYGSWPGLANARLDEGVDLAVATDYRRILGEVLQQRNSGAAVFPGYTSPGPLGLFGDTASHKA
jgi:hypothetical protein